MTQPVVNNVTVVSPEALGEIRDAIYDLHRSLKAIHGLIPEHAAETIDVVCPEVSDKPLLFSLNVERDGHHSILTISAKTLRAMASHLRRANERGPLTHAADILARYDAGPVPGAGEAAQFGHEAAQSFTEAFGGRGAAADGLELANQAVRAGAKTAKDCDDLAREMAPLTGLGPSIVDGLTRLVAESAAKRAKRPWWKFWA